MTELHDGCLDRSASDKEAGAIVYLMEELGDARMRCDQLIRGLSDGLKLIDKSSRKDHFYEIAGHLIQNVPLVAFKLQKALDAVALAAGRIDHEELKRSLRPEKVLELERVLEDVRIPQVQRRSDPFQLLTPRYAAEGLRRIAWMTRGASGLPQYETARLIHALEEGQGGDDPNNISEGLDKLADVVEEADGPDRALIASTLRRMLGDSLVRDFNDTEQRTANMATPTTKTALKLSEDDLQLADANEVAKKFKAENPDMTDADLEKVKEQWTKHKDSLKAAAWKTPTAASGAINVGRLERMVDTTEKQLKEMKHSLGLYKKDPAKNKTQLDNLAAAARSTMSAVRLGLRTMGVKLATDDDKASRFEEGKPADPTKNMTPEDKKKWEQANEDNKDKFKAGSWKSAEAKTAGGDADFARVMSSWLLNKEGDQLHKNVAGLLKSEFKRAGLTVPDGRLPALAHDLIYNFDGKTSAAAKAAWGSMMKAAKQDFSKKSSDKLSWKA